MQNNLLKLGFNQDSSKNVMNIKSKTFQATSGNSFKSVLDSTVNNKINHGSDTTNKTVDNQDNNTKVKYKSFAEVQMNVKTASNKTVSKPDESAEVSEVEDKDTNIKPEEYDQQISALAQMMGITPGQLSELAKKLGYSLQDLKDVQKLAAFMQKVSDLLELNDKQKDILMKLAAEVSNKIKPNESTNATETTQKSVSDVSALANKPSQEGKAVFELSKIATEIKDKLDAMINSGKSTPEIINDEVAKIISVMKAQAQSKITVNTQQTNVDEVKEVSMDSDGKGSVNEKSIKEEQKSKEAVKENTSKNAESSKAPFDLKSVSTSAQTTTSNGQNLQQDQQNIQAIGDIKAVLNSSQAPIEKSPFSIHQPVRTSEIVNQVVEQAKVILGQDKSEMVIQLKPDHLGKLELKVVTEQGIVAAKFIAESQQVKEIIETNMQLLKDSLQKQGISIDGVSVQVGQDNRSENRNQNLPQSKNNGSSNGDKYSVGSTNSTVAGTSLLENLPERLAQYTDDLNTINLTA